MYLLIAYGFGIPQALGSWQAVVGFVLLLTAVSNLATSIPAAQGSIGTFEFFAAATVVVMGIGGDLARAYAIALHVALLVPVTVAGLAFLWANNLSLRQILREGQGRSVAPEGAGAPRPASGEEPG